MCTDLHGVGIEAGEPYHGERVQRQRAVQVNGGKEGAHDKCPKEWWGVGVKASEDKSGPCVKTLVAPRFDLYIKAYMLTNYPDHFHITRARICSMPSVCSMSYVKAYRVTQ